MKNMWFVVLLMLSAFGVQSVAASPSRESCINLGVAPYGDASEEMAWRNLGLSADQIKQVREQTPQKTIINEEWPFAKMAFRGGKVRNNVRVCGSEKADLYIVDNGQGGKIVLVRPEKCNNWSLLAANVRLTFRQVLLPAPVVMPAQPLPAVAVSPPVVVTQAPAAPVPSKQVEKKPAGIEYDVYGQYKWSSSSTSRNQGPYVEGTVWNGDVGFGALASESRGHSTSTKSAWDIDLIALQLGFKGGETFVTADGRTERRLWQIKPRLGFEQEQTVGSKGQPFLNQRTILAGAYVENLKTDGKCLYGVVGGFWIPVGTSVNAGKEAEDRTSLYAHLRRECKIDERWSWRVDGGPSWSAVSGTALEVAGQFRYRTTSGVTFFVGPQVGWSFEKSGFFWAGFIGAQFGGVDTGVLHNRYVKDNTIVPTNRTGAEVFASVPSPVAATVAQLPSPLPAAKTSVRRVPTPPPSDEAVHRALAEWWAVQKGIK